ncbi:MULTISPECIES: ImuA family protein [Agrobacterium]|uniref:ImuA family protein n=1 Tax=Agrobacterium larrymoorei TaxID=160699 RepID=A0ABX8TC53_9HYPH|nr:ImuA family protein [Agrobacterium larrymoorei]NSZ10114.1 damage-inducible mutagenesis protein [Agrobacterium tumefaciens]QYA10828.1 ImuA family protein [Agrobacterium larrymoorei]
MARIVNSQVLTELQERIDQIAGGSAKKRPCLPFGVAEIDNRLPGGGLAYGCTHEIAGGGPDAVTGAASSLFAAGIAARTKGPVIWCLHRPDLFAPALQQVGLDMRRVIFVESDKEDIVLENAEEALRYGGIGAVIAETVRLPMVASRRLQLAAEQTGTLGLIVRRWRRQTEATDYGQPTASVTRWRVSSMPSEPLPVPGVGRPRWLIELMRSRAGEAFDIEVGACDDAGRMASIARDYQDWPEWSMAQ